MPESSLHSGWGNMDIEITPHPAYFVPARPKPVTHNDVHVGSV